MNTVKIWLDDQADDPEYPARKTPAGFTPIKNPFDFKEFINKCIKDATTIAAIDFDNDLGVAGEENEGYGLLKWLKENHPEIFLGEIELLVHSRNSVAAPKLEAECLRLMADKDYVSNLVEAKSLPNPWDTLPLR